MRFVSITAEAFGPLLGKTLQLATGMTVIVGPNEAGKSTWHAALYAGLCGVRRARGAPRAEDREFEERYRPWSGAVWAVAVRVELADGRVVELRHDLGQVDSRATDIVLGGDCSAEIIYEGAPDGSRWLGLDRRSFLATACIRQADVLGVSSDPALLRENLQRAAATAGHDETAAAALERLGEFQSERVGLDRANSTKPLRQGIVRQERALGFLEKAKGEHREFLKCASEQKTAEVEAGDAAIEVRRAEAAVQLNTANALRGRVGRAMAIGGRHPAGRPGPIADQQLSEDVLKCLNAWATRPEIRPLQGHTAEEIRAQIDLLPVMPLGDTIPHQTVDAAARIFDDAVRTVTIHSESRPIEIDAPATGGLSASVLRDMAHILEMTQPVVGPELPISAQEASRRLSRLRQWVWVSTGIGLVLLIAGMLLGGRDGTRELGALTATLAVVGFASAILLQRRAGAAADEERTAALTSEAAEQSFANWKKGNDEVRSRAFACGVPLSPGGLRALAAAVDDVDFVREKVALWRAEQERLQKARDTAECDLSAALAARGIEGEGEIVGLLARYVEECSSRRRQAEAARRCPDLEAQFVARVESEAAAVAAAGTYERARAGLHAVASRCGVAGPSDETIDAGLRAWLETFRARRDQLESALKEWAELEALLDGGTIEGLAAAATEKTAAAEAMILACGTGGLDGFVPEADLDGQVRRLRSVHEGRRKRADELRGNMDTLAKRATSVAEAEEEAAAAAADLARVRRLERTLSLTRKFLEDAQERVHRDIAPVLAASIRPQLSRLSRGRYIDVAVDPESLDVTVWDFAGTPRSAALLSRGTAEQIYLLLRIALVTHLTKTGEVAPLIMDDVTVQFDARRKVEVLDLLLEVSHERQVVLFSQEADVLAWARSRLTQPADSIIEIPDTPIGAELAR